MTRTALITGASRGIGKVIAERFAKEGIRVLIAAKSVKENPDLPGTIYSVKEDIRKKYPNSEVYPFQIDIRDDIDVIKLFSTINKLYGGVDILINNAGALHYKYNKHIYEKIRSYK